MVAIDQVGTLDVDSNGELAGSPGPAIARYEYDALGRRVRSVDRPGSPVEKTTRHEWHCRCFWGRSGVGGLLDAQNGGAAMPARCFQRMAVLTSASVRRSTLLDFACSGSPPWL